jgi:hypothetical protein
MIETCRTNHTKCHFYPKIALPTRLIDVGTVKDTFTKLHVIEQGEEGIYLALTYCWGMVPQVTAKRDNIEALEWEIHVPSLGQTIQDAIECTRRLGFRYLWVDALCIIQDDDVDKSREISNMASIYKNAAITLSAAIATKSSEGFLNQSRNYEPQAAFEFPMSDGPIGTLLLTPDIDYVPEHPLDTRGWTLQEYLLSPCLLIYSDYELLWQCAETPLCSVTGGKLEYLQPLQNLPFGIFSPNHEVSMAAFGSTREERMYQWKIIVEQYSGRRLSNPNDRLLALGGIASELSRLWADKYMFGLWKNWFVQLLAWYKSAADKQMLRSSRAPTWSWASIDGGIYIKESFLTEDALLLEENLLTLRSSKTVALSCKVITPTDLDALGGIEVLSEYDLAGDEAGDSSLYYLLLGVSKEKSKNVGVGLVMVKAETKDIFRRVGCGVFPDMAVWRNIKRRQIALE